MQLSWIIQNQTNDNWLQGVTLTNYCTKQCQGFQTKLNHHLNPKQGEAVRIILTIGIPKELSHEKFVLQFCFEDKDGKFGQSLVGIINIIPKSSLEIEDSFEERKVTLMKELEEPDLLTQAFALHDEGYGTFGRCQKILHAYRGDLQGAKDLLSFITMNDFNG